MVIKRKFNLLKGVDNILNLSAAEIQRISIDNGPRKIFVVLELMKNRLSHFTKDKVFKLISGLESRKRLNIINLPNYNLHVSYNPPNKGMIINLSPFEVDDIMPTKPGPIDLYATLVYAITFSSLISGKMKIESRYSAPIASFLHSIFMRSFAKQYGLLGSFTSEIPKLNFLTNVYVLASFFGETGLTGYKKASAASSFDYRELAERLNNYNFMDINDFIKSLSDFGVFPNINKHLFTAKIYNKYTINFIPGLEDLSRFISILTASEIRGTKIVPAYIYKYDERSFNNIIEISKVLFKRI